ncbi:MAG: YHS domain-containing protein, partial [Hyphomicrobium sp.]|nr:YHS domain-containing protein [Hyphomicrobium sp.]
MADTEHSSDRHGAHETAAAGTDRVLDPVCGMSVDPHATPHRARHDGRAYYFCSAGCRTKFEAEPSRYLEPSGAHPAHERGPDGTIYTCPMHPEVR